MQDLENKALFLQNDIRPSQLVNSPSSGLGQGGKTRLDKERMAQCEREMESVGSQARQWRGAVSKATVREKYRGSLALLDRIRNITEDVSAVIH